MSAVDVNILMTAAAAALESGAYDTAISKAVAAQALCSNLIRAKHGMQTEMEFSVEAIEKFIGNVRRMKSEAAFARGGGFQRTKFIYQRARQVRDCD